MTKFRPCIDLHSGQVKQIVGSTLNSASSDLKTNHISRHPAGYFANLYKEHALTGGHIIMLGPGNEEAAVEALSRWPGALHVGGGIHEGNAMHWIQRGAEKVIVTSCLFPNGHFEIGRLEAILQALNNDKTKLVIDLSCRKKDFGWTVTMNKWQTLTDMDLDETADSIKSLEPFCSEFLIHAADNEGLSVGIDEELVQNLGIWCTLPVTYAGGGKSLEDLETVKRISRGRVDLTIGSALDIFGGGVKLEDCALWNQKQDKS